MRVADVTAGAPAASRRGVWTTHLIDVSNNNGPVEYRTVAHNARKTGITGVLHKATEGTGLTDGLFAGARATAAHYGLRVGAYHFALPDKSHALAEADHFCNVVGKIEPYELRPMLDFETSPFDEEWAREWCLHVRERLGVAPLLYSFWSALVGMHLAKPVGDGLVLAYPNGLPRSAPVPRPWKRWACHQYSWHGHVAGVRGEVDLNWTPSVWGMLAFPVRGAAYEPVMRRRRRRA